MSHPTRAVAAIAAAVALLAIGAASAGAATESQYRGKCAAAWNGSKTTAAYRAYRSRCVAAAKAAVSAATDAGNPTSTTANTSRARAACGKRFPKPRNTAAKRKAYAACVTAASRSQRAYAPRPLRAELAGANEVPPAGTAEGTASIRLNEPARRVCFTLTYDRKNSAAPITAAHIHTGAAGATGPPLVDLSAAADVSLLFFFQPVSGCVKNVSRATLKAIRANPAGYYVNVHDQQFPAGASRGQLHA